MYSVGDVVKYEPALKKGQIKIGVVETAFLTLGNKPCYWISDESELILDSQVIEKVKPVVLEYMSFLGQTEKVIPKLNMYAENNNLYVGLDYLDSDCDTWLPYTDVTVNVGKLPFLESAIDTNNNGQEIVSFLEDNGFGKLTDKTITSGFYEFPVFKFDENKLKEIDCFMFNQYKKAHGRVVESRPLDETITKAAEIVKRTDVDTSQGIEKNDNFKER